jgi:antitoxin (DNA-binding transcriptional repressor) of toxin-antitoxin stability system
MVELSATEVARNFSAVLNRVLSGESIGIVRNGVIVAELRPPEPSASLFGESWNEMIATVPPVDDDFARDLEQIRDESELFEDRDPWRS